MQAIDKNKLVTALDYIVFLVIGIFSFLYMSFFSYFAKMHITLKLINAPVFVGEMLLVFCLFMLLIKVCLLNYSYKIGYLLIVCCYVSFVFTKTLFGYFIWGPLAFRHAALFYYPIFLLVGFSFYRRSFFSQPVITGVLLMLIAVFIYRNVYVYYTFTSLALGYVLLLKLKSNLIKVVMFLFFFAAFPYHDLFDQGRTRIIGNSVGFIVLALLLAKILLRFSRKMKFVFAAFFLLTLIVVVSKVSDKNAIISLTSWKENIVNWNRRIESIEKNEDRFKTVSLPVRIYQENKRAAIKRGGSSGKDNEVAVRENKRAAIKRGGSSGKDNEVAVRQKDFVAEAHDTYPFPKQIDPEARSIEQANNNILFRFLIWKDMLKELSDKKPVVGIDFGYPFRSKSLEILNWADDAWGRDGWIAAHNSYLEMIYRAGIVGIMLVVLIIYSVSFLLRSFVHKKSVTGILLVSIFAFSLTVANFTVFFEVPYTAIPFWLLLGISFAYCSELKTLEATSC